jgi:phosphatidylserine/phosphatidylglycerophosphate/cardiolipin synthase-like enzyme
MGKTRVRRQLHAKFFLIDEAAGFVGSANLTSSGLGGDAYRNRELTVSLGGDQRQAARAQFEQWWTAAVDVTPSMLKECETLARRVKVELSDELFKVPDLHTNGLQSTQTLDAQRSVGCRPRT